MARYFGVTIDELLSGDELLTIAEENTWQKENHLCDLVYGLLDCSCAMLLFLPLFAQRGEDLVRAVSLLSLTGLPLYLRMAYAAMVIGMVAMGIVTLALQSCHHPLWEKLKRPISLAMNLVGVLLLIISLQPYAAVLLLVFLIIKGLTLRKKA